MKILPCKAGHAEKKGDCEENVGNQTEKYGTPVDLKDKIACIILILMMMMMKVLIMVTVTMTIKMTMTIFIMKVSNGKKGLRIKVKSLTD